MHRLIYGTAILAVAFGAAAMTVPVAALAQDQVVASGKFKGKSGHATSGGVSVVKTAKGTLVVLNPDFTFDGAPDPKLGFGKNGYVNSTQFSALKSNSGEQTYEIPASIDPGDYTEVWVWCEQYSVPLGVAPLE